MRAAAWGSLVRSEKLGPAFDLMPRFVERSLTVELGRTSGPRLQTQRAMGRLTSSDMAKNVQTWCDRVPGWAVVHNCRALRPLSQHWRWHASTSRE